MIKKSIVRKNLILHILDRDVESPIINVIIRYAYE